MPTTILLTGANRGIGHGFTALYLSRPHTVLLATVRDPSHPTSLALHALPRHPTSTLHLLTHDAGSPTGTEDLRTQLAALNIRTIDLLIANAGVFDPRAHGPLSTLDPAHLRTHVEVNALGPLRAYQAAWLLLKAAAAETPEGKPPVFAVISGAAGTLGGMDAYPNFPLNAYAASKCLVNFLVRRVHYEELGLVGVALHPGTVATESRNDAARALGIEPEGITVEESVKGMVEIFDNASREKTSGRFLDYKGQEIPW